MSRLEADNLKKFSTHQVFSGDGSTVAFVLTYTPQEKDATLVFVNGLKAAQSEFTLVGSTITFSTAPAASSNIEVYYWRNTGES